MDWFRLLSPRCLGGISAHDPSDRRTAFQRDHDRTLFSSAFRRLQDKTQVFPLSQNDYVRTRLTHSLEVSTVGRTLATRVGEAVIRRHHLTGVRPMISGPWWRPPAACMTLAIPPLGTRARMPSAPFS